jgi:hypothetical protein
MTRLLSKAIVATLFAIALAGTAQAQAPLKPAPPASRFAKEYSLLRSPSWARDFPNLGRVEVLAPSTGKAGERGAYNCIAHSVKVYNRWVWEGDTVAVFDKLYGRYGYRRVKGLDYRFDSRYEKVVLYAKVHPNGRIECTHGSRQLADGSWTSKLGAGPLIRHARPESVAGPTYGKPIAVYVKARQIKTPAATTLVRK